eukprot:PhM_4_TR3016/c1_g1_i2/m.89342
MTTTLFFVSMPWDCFSRCLSQLYSQLDPSNAVLRPVPILRGTAPVSSGGGIAELRRDLFAVTDSQRKCVHLVRVHCTLYSHEAEVVGQIGHRAGTDGVSFVCPVDCCCVTPSVLAVVDRRDNAVHFVRWQDGHLEQSITVMLPNGVCVVDAARGLVAVTSGEDIHIFDWRSGVSVRPVIRHGSVARGRLVAVSPKVLAVAEHSNCSVAIVDWTTGALLRRIGRQGKTAVAGEFLSVEGVARVSASVIAVADHGNHMIHFVHWHNGHVLEHSVRDLKVLDFPQGIVHSHGELFVATLRSRLAMVTTADT